MVAVDLFSDTVTRPTAAMRRFSASASLVYSAAALGEFGPPERDTRGMAASLGHDGIPEPVIGLFVLAPAVLE